MLSNTAANIQILSYYLFFFLHNLKLKTYVNTDLKNQANLKLWDYYIFTKGFHFLPALVAPEYWVALE